MSKFNRRLTPGFIEALNREYEKTGSWWRRFVDDKDLFVANHDNSLDVYCCGARILGSLKWTKKTLRSEIHYKYLRDPKPKKISPNIHIIDGRPKNLNHLSTLKKAVERVQDGRWKEKTGVHDIVLRNPNSVLDVEVAISEGKTAPRIDFAAIQGTNSGPTIVFYEAKHIDNKEDLRSESRNLEVLNQMRRYEGLLETHEKHITNSYREVCKNLCELNGFAERHPKRHAILKEVANRPETLSIDPRLRLVVFGKLGENRQPESWEPHRERLERELGNRVLFRDDPKKIVLSKSA